MIMSKSKWSELPSDILSLIADRLNNNNNNGNCDSFPNIDNLRLRSVCTSWRSVSFSLSPHITTTPPFPIILPNPDCRKGHFTLSVSSTYLLQSPSPSSTPYWLIRIQKINNSCYKTRSALKYRFRFLNPLDNNYRPLSKGFPKSINLLDFRISRIATFYTLNRNSLYRKKVVASTNSSGSVVAIVARLRFKLWFFQTQWTQVLNNNNIYDIRGGSLMYADVVFHNGRFYAVDVFGKLVSFAGGSDLNVVEIVPLLDDNHGFMHLVESNGALYLVVKRREIGEYLGVDETVHFKIYKLNEEEREWETVTHLDNHAFFLGMRMQVKENLESFVAILGFFA